MGRTRKILILSHNFSQKSYILVKREMSTSNINSTTETQCNGGSGYHRPDQYLKPGANFDEKENDYDRTNSNRCNADYDKDAEVGYVRNPHTPSCQRKWTPREIYLLTICGLLFLACVAFVLIAFVRDSCHHCHHHSKWVLFLFEPLHDKTNKMICAPSEGSDQPGHLPCLIRVRCPHEETFGP